MKKNTDTCSKKQSERFVLVMHNVAERCRYLEFKQKKKTMKDLWR